MSVSLNSYSSLSQKLSDCIMKKECNFGVPTPRAGWMDGVAILREDKKDQYREYVSEMTAIAHREDMAAAKYDANHPVSLSDGQLNDLLSRYDPRSMSKAEYSAFIRDMVEMGVITEDDTRFLRDIDGRTAGAAVQLFTPGALGGRALDTATAPYFYHRCTFPKTFEESGGDILTWYGFEAAYRTYDPSSDTYYQGKEERTYGKVYGVLQQMERKAESSAQREQNQVQKSYQTSRLAWDLKNSRNLNPK